MKIFLYSCIWGAMFFFGFAVTGSTQPPADSAASAVQHASHRKSLFETDVIPGITLSGNMRELLNDRSENSQYHPMLLSYNGEDSNKVAIPVKIKTRGHFRKLKENCFYPPLLISFSKTDTLKSSVFQKQDKLKLVMPCKDDDYVIREWLVYKLYNLVTPKSFRAKLVSVNLEDTKNKKTTSPFYGIFLEDEDQMAKRNDEISVTRKMRPEDTNPYDFLTMAMFEYLIGNTDWSVQFLQNIKLIAADSAALPTTVPYDFDHAGIIGASYAKPAEELRISSVKERRYRGYCMPDMQKFDSVIALYNRLKPGIYELYNNCTLLDAKYLKTTIKYLDDFYEIINNPVAFKKVFTYPCDKNGTGNVVIKGLRED